MKLASLLEQHRKFESEPGARVDCFGDGFLLKHNSFYKRARTSALKLGFEFSNAQNDLYRALPLSQLHSILQSRVIPYIDNVTVLEQIEAKIPRLTLWDDISDNLKGNSVFHEACHAMAHAFVIDFPMMLARETGLNSYSARILSSVFEESFANTLELLSIIDAGDQIHRIFIELNSYAYMLDDRVHLINAVKDVGLKSLTKFLLLMYAQSNLLVELTDKSFDHCVRLATDARLLEAKSKKSLRQLAKIAFKLNPRFREVTTLFHLKINGIQTDIAGLQSFDVARVVEDSRAAQAFLASSATY